RPANDQDRDAGAPPDLDDRGDTIALRGGEVENDDIRIVLSNHIKEPCLDIRGYAGGVVRAVGYPGDRQIFPRDNYCRCSHRSLAICKWRDIRPAPTATLQAP